MFVTCTCIRVLYAMMAAEAEMLGRQNGAELRVALARAVMEYRMSSYRAIMASTAAILHSEAASIPEEPKLDDNNSGTVEAPDEGVVRDIVDHRFQIVFELFYTERRYLLQLESVLDTYAEPFRKFTALSKQDHRVLFVGLEPIVSLSAMVLSKLDDAVQSWDPATTKIGNLFSSKYWKYYDDYASNYGAIKSTLEDKYQNDESFVEFLNLRQGSSPFSLEDLLTLPVQRIPEYDKYLNELLQETDQSHPDFEDLKRAADKVRNMVKEREDELYNMDNQKRMERVQDKFPHDDLQLRDLDTEKRQLASRRKSAPGAVLFKTLGKSKSTNNILAQSMGKKELEFFRPSRQFNFNRQYLMEGLVEFSRGMQTQDRYLFLFSDLLLVAKQKSTTTFKLKHRVRVCELWISFCIDDVTELTRPADRSFVIGWPTTNVVATFKSFDLKETWLNKLNEQIQEERGKQVPKSLMLEIMNKEIDKSCELEVDNETDARSVVQTCLNLLQISDSEAKDYQLWVKLGNDESPYPLVGHELPYSIKMSHIREYAKRSEDTLNEIEIQQILTEMNNNNNRKYEFVLKHNKKSPKKHSLEEHSGPKKSKRKSPLISLFRKNREDKKPVGKLFGHQLTNITTPEELIAKPVKELLTILFREGPYTVGILRKSPNAKMLKELRQKIDDGEDCLSNETWPPLVIGALLKDFLRNIPQSLLMEEYFDDWAAANEILDGEDKINKLRDTISKLPLCHFELLRHLMCVLHYIHKRSEENKMTAYNLSVCIAPSLLWPKGNPDPLATPPAIVEYMIENCGQVFGEESLLLYGEVVEQKLRQDSSTDSDSMHSVLSLHSNFRRDDSSIDSLEREFYTQDSSPRLLKSHHLSPSNLSGDSGLTMSDSQLYDDDGNGNDIGDRRHYIRSASHFLDRDVERPESEASRSLDNQYFYRYVENNPVPPPRKNRPKNTNSPNLEHYRKPMRISSHGNFHGLVKNDKRNSQNIERYVNYPRKMSSESLKSVEEAMEANDDRNVKDWHSRPDMGTLVKSASGAHLYYEDFSNLRLYEFDTQNEVANHKRQLYKQKSCPVSPQSKYSLSSSRDSVLSDSSGSYLERQYFPDTMSSSVETPEMEDRTMADWLTQQSKQVAYATRRQRRLHSHDDSEVGLVSDSNVKHKEHMKDNRENQAMRNVQHLVSPRVSPKIKRRAPLPLSVCRSFPIEHVNSPKGSGSNTSKEAEDIITSPKLTITYCSQDSLDKREAISERDKSPVLNLDVYNNNSQLALKQLNLYSSGLQGTSPPPRVVLQNLSQSTEKRDNTPVKASYDSAILSQVRRNSIETGRRNSLDMGDLRAQRYPMEENSVSSEDEQTESESESDEDIEACRYTTYMKMSPFKYSIPQKLVPIERKSNSSESLSKISKKSSSSESLSKASRQSSSQESLSRNSTTSEDSIQNRPENPPCYQEAVHRKFLLDNGMPLEDDDDEDTVRQREASLRAKQLYEQSMRQYQEQKERYPPLPSQQFEQKLDVVGEHHENVSESDSQTSSEDEDIEWAEKTPRRLYEESLKRYMAEQTRSPLVKTSSTDDGTFSNSKGGLSEQKHLLSVSGLHRSHSDVGDMNKRLRSPFRDQGSPTITNSSHSSSRESTPTRRPDHPPPYDSPPPYRHDHRKSSPVNADRHYFPKADKLFYQSPAQSKETSTQITKTGQDVPDSRLSVRSRNGAQTQSNQEVLSVSRVDVSAAECVPKTAQVHKASNIDNTVHSAQVDISKYKSPVRNIRASDVRNIRSKDNVVIIRSRNSSQDSLLKQQSRKQTESNVHTKVPKTSEQVTSSTTVFRSRSSSLEPKDSQAIQAIQSQTLQSQLTRPAPHRFGVVSRSAVDGMKEKSVECSKTDSPPRRNSLDTAVNRTAVSSSSGGHSGKELPWSVKNIRTMFDKNKQLGSSDSDSSNSTPVSVSQSSDSTPSTSPQPRMTPTCTPPPLLQQRGNISRSSTSSNSSVNSNSRGYKGAGMNRNTYTGRYGPQTHGDSFSSSDSSDCSCRYSLKCRRDDSSLEELNNLNFTDISYV